VGKVRNPNIFELNDDKFPEDKELAFWGRKYQGLPKDKFRTFENFLTYVLRTQDILSHRIESSIYKKETYEKNTFCTST